MSNHGTSPEVVIVGSGPAGLAAGIELRRRGVASVAILEREFEAGGVPRHCGHPPFGMREFQRVLTGPRYARRLVERAAAAGVELRMGHTVVTLYSGGAVDVTSSDGVERLRPKRIILATGTREAPRSERLVGGDRPLGVLNTGALQGMVYLKGLVPFRRPVIVGSELVSFSALLTCRHAGIEPVGMIDEVPRPVARRPSELLPRVLGISLVFNTRLQAIYGETRVEAVETVDAKGHRRTIECDGVLMTGNFAPEASLVRSAPISFDLKSGGPEVDQYGRCSDSAYFAAGNILRAVETAGWSYREGKAVGGWVADDLAGHLPASEDYIAVRCDEPIKYAVPQRICPPLKGGFGALQLRVMAPVRGHLEISRDECVLYKRRVAMRPERRLLIPFRRLRIHEKSADSQSVTLNCRIHQSASKSRRSQTNSFKGAFREG